MKGRKPKPTGLLVLEGNPGKQNLAARAAAEPKPRPVAPECPEHLDDIAKNEWARIVPDLHAAGLAVSVDGAALAAYCQIYSRWVQAEQEIQKYGMLVKGKDGVPKLTPYLSVVNHCLEQMKGYLVEFGMTASSRTRIGIQKQQNKDEYDPIEAMMFTGAKR